MNSRATSRLVIEYFCPKSYDRPRYVFLRGLGNQIKTDLFWYAGQASWFNDTPLGLKDAQECMQQFADHTELDIKYLKVVRLKMSFEEATFNATN